MVVTGSGNVGIDITAFTKLHIGHIGYIRNDNATYGTNDAVLIVAPKASSNTVLNDPQDALILARPGSSSQAWHQAAHFRISRYENSATDSRTRLDFALGHNSMGQNAQGGAAPDNIMTLLSSGNVGIGTETPDYKLDVRGDTL